MNIKIKLRKYIITYVRLRKLLFLLAEVENIQKNNFILCKFVVIKRFKGSNNGALLLSNWMNGISR